VIYPFYLALQVEIALKGLLRQTPAANRIAESLADLMRALPGQRSVGIVAGQRPAHYGHLVGAELIQWSVQAIQQLAARPRNRP